VRSQLFGINSADNFNKGNFVFVIAMFLNLDNAPVLQMSQGGNIARKECVHITGSIAIHIEASSVFVHYLFAQVIVHFPHGRNPIFCSQAHFWLTAWKATYKRSEPLAAVLSHPTVQELRSEVNERIGRAVAGLFAFRLLGHWHCHVILPFFLGTM
jgi:hypothetical protein